jgi:hypothetical protein
MGEASTALSMTLKKYMLDLISTGMQQTGGH